MRRGLLKDYANQVCQMAVGWRLIVADLPLLVERGEGLANIDLLARTSAIDGVPVPLAIVGEVVAWLDEAQARDGLPPGMIQGFTMELFFRITEEHNGRAQLRRVELDSESLLRTADADHAGACCKRELWTRTSPEDAWHVRERDM